MTTWLQPMLEWVSLHPVWSSVVIAAISLAESLFIVGLFIPGIPVMTGVGALIGSGVLPLHTSLLAAVGGAIAGDSISYWLGKHYHRTITTWKWVQRYPMLMPKGEAFFRKYGGTSIVIGRFIGPVRPIIPAVAGMMGMPPGLFLVYNVISACLWAPAYILPGAFLGSSVIQISLQATFHLLLLLLLSAIACTIGYRLLRLGLTGIHMPLDHQLKRVWDRIMHHPRLQPLHAQWAHAYYPTAYLPLVQCIGVLAGLICLGIVVHGTLYALPEWTLINHTAMHFVRGLATPTADLIMVALSLCGKLPITGAFYLGILIVAYQQGDRWTVIHGLGLAAITAVGLIAFKWGIHAPRPQLGATADTLYSFPSGHVTRVGMVLGFWALINVHPLHENPWRQALWGLALGLTGAVGYSRMYLNAHWFTDILGAALLTSTTLLITSISYRRKPVHGPWHDPEKWRWGLLCIPWLCALPAVLYYGHQMEQDVQWMREQSAWKIRLIDPSDWWGSQKPGLVPTRKALLGNHVPTLNIQVDLPLAEWDRILASHGWKASPALTIPSLISWLDPQLPLHQLPLLTQFHHQHKPVLTRVQQTAEPHYVMVLRLWRSQYALQPDSRPLWVGTVHFQTRKQLGFLTIPYPETLPPHDLNHAAHALANSMRTETGIDYRFHNPQEAQPAQLLIRHGEISTR